MFYIFIRIFSIIGLSGGLLFGNLATAATTTATATTGTTVKKAEKPKSKWSGVAALNYGMGSLEDISLEGGTFTRLIYGYQSDYGRFNAYASAYSRKLYTNPSYENSVYYTSPAYKATLVGGVELAVHGRVYHYFASSYDKDKRFRGQISLDKELTDRWSLGGFAFAGAYTYGSSTGTPGQCKDAQPKVAALPEGQAPVAAPTAEEDKGPKSSEITPCQSTREVFAAASVDYKASENLRYGLETEYFWSQSRTKMVEGAFVPIKGLKLGKPRVEYFLEAEYRISPKVSFEGRLQFDPKAISAKTTEISIDATIAL